MNYEVINLKENNAYLDVAIANMEIEIEKLSNSNYLAIKFIHGYGSHGVGGVIAIEARKKLATLKKHKKIKDFILGIDFNMSNPIATNLLYVCPDLACDEDFNHNNPGITIVILNN